MQRKHCITLVLLSFCFSLAFAQFDEWDGDSGIIDRVSPIFRSGQVGIGLTSAPTHPLEVSQTASNNGILATFGEASGSRLFMVPQLGLDGLNQLSQQNDIGLFWSDAVGDNQNAGFIFGPQKAGEYGLRIDANGKVLIGEGDPSNLDRFQLGTGITKLGLGSAFTPDLNYGVSYIGFNAVRSTSGWLFNHDTANNGGAVIYGNVGGDLYFSTVTPTIPDSSNTNQIISDSSLYTNTKLTIKGDGRVIIGDVNTNIGHPDTMGYKLYVRTGILTERVKVALHSSSHWADYVFKENYPLLSLPETEVFIQENGHLPNVPSAEELMEEGGVELGSMTVKQQEKIEELFLYVIDLGKKIKVLETENKQLKLEIEKLKHP